MAVALSRRRLLAATASLGLTSMARASAPAQPGRGSLAEAAGRGGRLFGSAVRRDQLSTEVDLREAVLRHCRLVTPEIALQWAALSQARGALQFAEMDDLAAFALAHGLKMRGHALLWTQAIPAWAAEQLRESQDWSLIRRQFASVMPRYGDVVEEWDVVNEAIDTGHRTDGLRGNVLLEAFGPEYIRRALDDARLFAPRALLTLNEYGLEYGNQVEADRRYLFLKLLERLKRAGAPLNNVGLQSHLDLSKGPLAEQALEAMLAEIAGMGLSITVTELDVKEAEPGRPVAERDRRTAAAVKEYLEIVLAQPAVRGVVTWGLSDRHSWLSDAGLSNRGLPLDPEMRPTPVFDALMAAFDGAPRALQVAPV